MAPGTRVGTVIESKYRLDEQIGQGGMGAVYRGVQLAVDRPVAIKLLHPNFAGHDKLQARFEVEAKAIARLNHPNCITLFDFGYSDELDAFYTVVEFIDGTPLESLISKRASVARVVDLIRQISSALGHAHHHGILHRDLKPENIMIAAMTDGSEMVKVLDFGIAQIMKGNNEEEDGDDDDFEADRLTRVGEVFGTPPYMSPEQAQSTRHLTPAADLYSLGIIFYELLEGRLPFIADAPVDILTMHLQDPPPPLNRHDIPQSIKDIVMQLLAKSPEERPESGGRVIELLDAIPREELTTKSPAIGAPGATRPSDPTLISSPDENSPVPRSGIIRRPGSPTMLPEPDELGPGEASVIMELTDIVDEKDIPEDVPSLGQQQQRASVSVDATATLRTSKTPVPHESNPSNRSTQTFIDELDQSNHKRNLVVFVSIILMLGFGISAWWINSTRDENLANSASAAQESTDTPQMDLDESPSEPTRDESDILDDQDLPRQISVAEHDRQLEEQTDAGNDTQPDVESESASPEPQARPTRPRPRPRPRPAPRPTNDAPDLIPMDDGEEDEEEPRRPTRMPGFSD